MQFGEFAFHIAYSPPVIKPAEFWVLFSVRNSATGMTLPLPEVYAYRKSSGAVDHVCLIMSKIVKLDKIVLAKKN
jgi:hypothetical protein